MINSIIDPATQVDPRLPKNPCTSSRNRDNGYPIIVGQWSPDQASLSHVPRRPYRGHSKLTRELFSTPPATLRPNRRTKRVFTESSERYAHVRTTSTSALVLQRKLSNCRARDQDQEFWSSNLIYEGEVTSMATFRSEQGVASPICSAVDGEAGEAGRLAVRSSVPGQTSSDPRGSLFR